MISETWEVCFAFCVFVRSSTTRGRDWRLGRKDSKCYDEDDDDLSLRGQGEVEVDVEDGVDVDNSLPPFWLQLAPSLARFPIFPFYTNGQRQRNEREGEAGGGYKLHSYAGIVVPPWSSACSASARLHVPR